MKRLLLTLIVCSFIALFLMPVIVFAQGNRASITGTVFDSSGAVVVGAHIVARNVDTGIETPTVSNDRGIYLVPNLPPGTYSVFVRKEGFKQVEFTHITLILDQVAELNATMAAGAAVEAVTVTGGAPVLETETSTIGTNMNGNVVTDLPLNVYGGRQAEYFAVALTPGYSPLSDPYLAVINGSQGFTKDFTVDGTSGTANLQGDIFESGPSMEAIEELHAETSGLSAKNAITNGGLIMLNLKSGTNKFHGSVFGYGHNEILDANTYDNNALMKLCLSGDTTDAVPPCSSYRRGEARFWDYGFSAGGPIVKNKTFIFGTFERYQQHDFTPAGFGNASTVPTPDFLNGNFSALLDTTKLLGTDTHGNPIYQGAIFNPADSGAVFVGNIIPTSSFSGVGQKIVALYEKYYSPERTQLQNNDRLPSSNSPIQTPNQVVIKLDHNLSQNDRLSGSWVYNHRPRTLVDSGGIWSPGSSDGGPMSNARFQKVIGHEVRVNESHTFAPNLLNQVNATWNYYWNGSLPTIGTNWPQYLGFGNAGVANNFPQIGFGADRPYGVSNETFLGNKWQGNWISHNYIYGDQLTWTRGRHIVTLGGDFQAMQINSHSGPGVLGFNFSPDSTGAPGTPYAGQVGFGFASMLLGEVQNASVNNPSPYNLYGRRKAMSLFAQDDFKATRKLTLNAGLRWDVNFRLHEKYGNWANFNLNAIDPNLGIKGALEYAKNGSDSFERKQDWTNFGPTIGFAYNPFEKLVLRGNFGILYVPVGMGYYEGIPYGFDGFRGTNSASGFNWANGNYPGVFTAGTKSTTPDIGLFPIATVNPRALFTGYTDNFNIGAQYELTKTSRIEVSYIANRGHRLQDSALAYNQPSASTFFKLYNSPSGAFWGWVNNSTDAAAASAASGVPFKYVPYPYDGNWVPNYALIAPYPQLGIQLDTYWYYPTLYYVGNNVGQSYYDSMVVHYVKRTGHGLMADVSYTLSRMESDSYTNMGDSWNFGLYGIQDFNNLAEAAHTLSPYDTKNVFKAGLQYELPFGHGHQLLGDAGRIVNAIASGWTISPLLTYATGKPMSFYSNDVYSLGWPAWSAIYVNYDLSNYHGSQFDPSKFVYPTSYNPSPTQNRYFPTGVASDPTLGQLGTGKARIDALRTFGTDREDIALHKYFKMGADGQYSLAFGVEFYNVFNRHAFADPVSSLGSNFGQVLGLAGSPRQGQFEARFRW